MAISAWKYRHRGKETAWHAPEPTTLNTGQRLVLEFASSDILGMIGKAQTLFTPGGMEWPARSAMPDVVARLINSIRTGDADDASADDTSTDDTSTDAQKEWTPSTGF
ncbi:hypothetical protein [Bifidobacterium jacchi]|uniref:Uncharacterized protein n=1 Tax=Bifidobacterium jacchi TaxID=2490545 RepID=A0A5N5RLV4_9BIFI|nr:hypothetical protein [Bifidobacterium jacchi]KAB5608325.1 hypothetical protein EHS19_01475 [Bifidobacterium jacchi]